ncbi:hypothetical protein RND71_002018 [Anisodus tanguticus]|uniref:Uncharacterized protein n=1 Tax=Anisodus tanguticus TaxID=243964 RepID=A0AAE1VW91_9SOLA|nr:hypothetical protein RND71_002018 [Anisodus tanguticus]
MGPHCCVLFPLMIMLLVPVRQYLLPRFFKGAHLQELDAFEYEEAPPLSSCSMTRENEVSFADDAEILDGMMTRSGGEIRRICSSKVTSCNATPARDSVSIQSPRLSNKVYSPRVSEIKGESPRLGRGGSFGSRTGEARRSNLSKLTVSTKTSTKDSKIFTFTNNQILFHRMQCRS